MQSIKHVGVAVVAVVALSATMASNATAVEFIASKTGKLVGKALNTQKFTTGGPATIECTEAAISGEVTALKMPTLLLLMMLPVCTAVHLGSATVSGFRSTYSASPGLILSENVTITVAGLGAACKIVIDSGQPLGSAPKEIEYVNKAGKIEIKEAITKVESEVVESSSELSCGKVGEKNTSGTLSGSSELELEGGTIEVK
jgi:hypothetical protein